MPLLTSFPPKIFICIININKFNLFEYFNINLIGAINMRGHYEFLIRVRYYISLNVKRRILALFCDCQRVINKTCKDR
jgi:hypothetical protein